MEHLHVPIDKSAELDSTKELPAWTTAGYHEVALQLSLCHAMPCLAKPQTDAASLENQKASGTQPISRIFRAFMLDTA